jgi:hypothetical protein
MSRARIYPYGITAIDGKLTDTWGSTDHRYGEMLGCLVDTVTEISTDFNGDGTVDATGVAVQQIYRCVRNTSAAILDAGKVVTMDSGATDIDHVEMAPASATTSVNFVRGVVVTPIPIGEEGWVVCKGYVNSISDDSTAIAAAGALTVGKGGVLGTVEGHTIGTDAEIGFAFAAIAINDTPTIYINVL